MAVSENTGGSTLITTLDVEQTLATVSTAGTFILAVDTNVLADDETLFLRIYTKVRTGSTSRLAYEGAFKHSQGLLNKYSVPVASPFEAVFKIEQSGGTARTFEWSVYEL